VRVAAFPDRHSASLKKFGHKMDRHLQTKKMTDPAEQFPLPGMGQPHRRMARSFTLDDVRNLKSEAEAIEFSVSRSKYDPKAIPSLFDIDQGQWSCILSGTKHFPHLRRNDFMNLVSNGVLLIYGGESRNYDFSTLRKHCTDTEQELAEAKERIRELEHNDRLKDQWLQSVLGGRR